MKRGRKTTDALYDELRWALRNLSDPVALEESRLATLDIVQVRARSEFERRTCPTGLALASVLREILQDISSDLGSESAVGVLADRLRMGHSQAETALALSVSEEHLSRRFKPILLQLALRRLQDLNREAKVLSLNYA